MPGALGPSRSERRPVTWGESSSRSVSRVRGGGLIEVLPSKFVVRPAVAVAGCGASTLRDEGRSNEAIEVGVLLGSARMGRWKGVVIHEVQGPRGPSLM